jgi:hypothetical protein
MSAHFMGCAGCEFEVIEAPLEEPVLSHYRAAARMWNQLRREFLYAAEQVRGPGALGAAGGPSHARWPSVPAKPTEPLECAASHFQACLLVQRLVCWS